jgi:3-dehydroquinate dehydratase-2
VQLLVLNGPNLNLLGTRRPDIYGTETLRDLEDRCRRWGLELGATVTTLQSNHEGTLIDALQGSIGRYDGIVLNPGAFAHYSYALHDAIEGIPVPVIEVHISDIAARDEKWRKVSVISPVCSATITGKGTDGYRDAIALLTAGDAPG